MSKYNVYGIGNALVDLEFEVMPEFLAKHDIEKGVMTLVDSDRQQYLIQAMDGLQHKRCCGGSAVNTVIAVAQLGGLAFGSCRVATDEYGDFYLKDIDAHGVKTNLDGQSRPEGHTGKCMVFVTPDADRTMNTFLGVSTDLSSDDISEEDLKNSEYLYIEGYLVSSPTGKEAALESKRLAEKHGVKTSLTFSDPGFLKIFREGFVEVLGETGVDLLFCNEDEALGFTGETELAKAVEKLKKVAKAFAITQGPRGAYLFDGEKEIDIVTTNVEAIDTTGAGDLFAGSFLYAITNGHSFGEAGKLACATASQLVTQFGARLTGEQTQEILKRILQ